MKAILRVHTPLCKEKRSYIQDCKVGETYMTDSTMGEITVLERVKDPGDGRVHYIIESQISPCEWLPDWKQDEYEYINLFVIPKDIVLGEQLDPSKGYYTKPCDGKKLDKKELIAWAELIKYSSAEFLKHTSKSIVEWVESEEAQKHLVNIGL